MVNAGSFRFPITIEARSGSQDASGQVIYDWAPIISTYASIAELSGNERLVAQQLFASVNVRMRIRYQTGIDATMRVTDYKGAHYDISSVMDPDGTQQQLELLCILRPEAQ